jgi:hypothetical protein
MSIEQQEHQLGCPRRTRINGESQAIWTINRHPVPNSQEVRELKAKMEVSRPAAAARKHHVEHQDSQRRLEAARRRRDVFANHFSTQHTVREDTQSQCKGRTGLRGSVTYLRCHEPQLSAAAPKLTHYCAGISSTRVLQPDNHESNHDPVADVTRQLPII